MPEQGRHVAILMSLAQMTLDGRAARIPADVSNLPPEEHDDVRAHHVRLRAHGLIPALASVNLDLHNIVLPALRRVIGTGLVLPAQITVTADGVYNGVVNATSDKEGRIVAVGDTKVGVSGSPVQVRWVLGHEIAHHHDLTTRMRSGVVLGHVGATVLWSEYFAQRVVHDAGLACDLGLDAASPPDPPAENDGGGTVTANVTGEIGYALSWLMAHRDHDPRGWCQGVPAEKVPYIEMVLDSLDGYDVGAAYCRFPSWTPTDVSSVGAAFRALAEHMIPRTSP